jgi:CRISPR/Cas system-associated exonuclease Cas4 (RecB family)
MAITIRKNPKFTDLLQKNLKSRYEDKRRVDNVVHVSDIIPTTCIRKQYYSRKFPELDPLSNESVHHFVRGESSEFVITELASLGVAQANIEMDGIVAHPDIMNEVEDVIVELKDTVNGKRLDITDGTFRAYLRQLLYYLVMTGIEKGIISIRYNIRELRWIKSDSEGNDYFFRPFNAKDVGIESWEIHLPATDVAREILKNEMVRRKNLFLKALEENDVSVLPRLPEFARNKKCGWCPFYDKCMNKDNESDKAKEMANEIDILDISGVVDFKPVIENSDR